MRPSKSKSVSAKRRCVTCDRPLGEFQASYCGACENDIAIADNASGPSAQLEHERQTSFHPQNSNHRLSDRASGADELDMDTPRPESEMVYFGTQPVHASASSKHDEMPASDADSPCSRLWSACGEDLCSPRIVMFFIVLLAVFFGLFFGLNFPEIQLHQQYAPTSCFIVSSSVAPRFCPQKQCSCPTRDRSTSECLRGSPACNIVNVVPPYANATRCSTFGGSFCPVPAKCCNGPGCCGQCGSKKRCCYKPSNQDCTILFSLCYSIIRSLQYDAGRDLGMQALVQYVDFGLDNRSAISENSTIAANTTVPCFFDRANLQNVVFSFAQYSPWKWWLLASFAVPLLLCIVGFSWHCIRNVGSGPLLPARRGDEHDSDVMKSCWNRCRAYCRANPWSAMAALWIGTILPLSCLVTVMCYVGTLSRDAFVWLTWACATAFSVGFIPVVLTLPLDSQIEERFILFVIGIATPISILLPIRATGAANCLVIDALMVGLPIFAAILYHRALLFQLVWAGIQNCGQCCNQCGRDLAHRRRVALLCQLLGNAADSAEGAKVRDLIMLAIELGSRCENPHEMVELFQTEAEAALRRSETWQSQTESQHSAPVDSVLDPSLSTSLLAGEPLGSPQVPMRLAANTDSSDPPTDARAAASVHAASCVGRELLCRVQRDLGIQVEPFQCPVCLDDVSPPLPTAALIRSVSEFRTGATGARNRGPALAAVNLQQCRHPVCLACFTRAVELAMRDKLIAHCPCAPRCGERIVELDVSRFVSLEGGNAYALIEQRDISMHPPIDAKERVNTRLFNCPTPDCLASIIVDTRARDYGAKWTCAACRVAHCVRCELPWHRGSTCAAHQQWRRENGHAEDEMQRLVRERKFKTCKCGALVERLNGCSKLTCLCGARLCDKCGTIFEKVGDRCEHTHYNG